MDSLTNVFNVTEVTGLKWVCLAVSDHRQHAPKNAEADLVLTAYRLCLAQGHLCTWRRKPNGSHDAIFNDPAPKMEAEKELWIFWYALNEPKCVEEFKEKYGLSACRDYESSEVALNYETRLLFYKAIHSAFERNLLKAGYLRFARWFVRPAEMPLPSGFPGIDTSRRRSLPRHVNAFNFHFFLHGEASVCMTVNVQHQPTLVRLSSKAFLSQLRKPQQVILAPWSLRARLLADQSLLMCGAEKSVAASSSNYQNEPQKLARLQWTHWKTEFPEMAVYEGELDRSGLPRMVVVEVGRVRMLYPTCFVAVVVDEIPNVSVLHAGRDMQTPDHDYSIATQMSFEDACSGEPLGRMPAVKLENGNGEHSSWHMADYVKRESCHCRLCTTAADYELLPSTSASGAILGRCSTGDFPGKAFHGRTFKGFKGRRATRSGVVSELPTSSAFVSELSSLRIPSSHAHEEKGLEQWELPPLWARTLSSSSSNSRTRDLLLTVRLDPGALNEADVLKALSLNSISKQFNHTLPTLPSPVFTPFSPVSSIHHDPGSDPFGLDDETLPQRLRDFDYVYNPLKLNPLQCAAEPYHFTEEVEKQMLVGPPRGRREDSNLIANGEQPPPPPPHPLSQRVEEGIRRSSLYNDAEGSSSILKSLLNNHSANGNNCRGGVSDGDGDKEEFSSKLMRGGIPKLVVHHRQPLRRIVHARHGSLEKRRRRRKIIWPSVESLDVLLVARMLDEEPAENAHSEWHEGSRESTAPPTYARPSLVAQLLRGEATILGAVPQPQSTTEVDILSTNDPPAGESAAHMEAVVDSVAITDATAATPPALLSTESCDDGETSTTKKDGEGKDGPIGSYGHSPASVRIDGNPSIAKSTSMPLEEEVGGNSLDQQQPRSIPPPQSSDHLHNILSPPASNEALLESMQQPGSSGSSMGALLSQQTLLNNSMQPPLSHEVSFPYPTPPTPMQFSPQGGLLTTTTLLVGTEVQNCHYSGSIAQPSASTSVFSAIEDASSLSPVRRHKRRLTVEEFSASKCPTLIGHLFNELLASRNGENEQSEEEVFNGTAEVQFPQCASFSGDLLGGVGKLSTRLEQLCSHASYEQKKELKSALKARVKRRKLGASKTTHYRKNLVERMRLPSMDAILASQLQRAEMALIGTSLGPVPANNRHSGGGGVSPQSLNPRSNSTRQQHSMGASTSGGFSPTGQSLVSPTGQPQHSPHRAPFARLPPPPLPLSSPSSSLQPQQRNAPLEYQLSSISSASSTSNSSIPTSASGVLPVSGRMFSALSMDSGAMMANQLSSCNSSTIGVLLRDTLLDTHYDAVFDSCPICCCTASIVASREFGMFITANDEMRRCMSTPTQRTLDDFSGLQLPMAQDGVPVKCNCGFSSVRHRLLCDRTQHGLFLDDVVEACGRGALAPRHLQNAMHNFDPAATKERRLADLLRHLSISRDLFPSSLPSRHSTLDTLAAASRRYTVSRLELEEVEGAAVSVTRSLGTRGGESSHSQALNAEASIVHSWGMQLAADSCSGLEEPRETEYLAEMREIRSITEEVVRRAREGAQSFSSKLEPLSWRSLLKRSLKQALPVDSGSGSSGGGGGGDESNLRGEPLPHLIVATEREPVMVSPQAISMWEKLSLAPFDQTKDVLYVGIAPDDTVVVEKLRVYLEELSRTYEKCRFGSHARLAAASSSSSSPNRREPVPDPILRIPLAAAPSSSCSGGRGRINEMQAFDNGGSGGATTQHLNSFAEALERELLRFFRDNDAVFERRSYHESLLRHNYTQHSHTSLGNSAEANGCMPGMHSFPPPHLPIQSPNSILSSTSGPHSTTIAMISPSSSSLLSNNNNQQQPSPLVSTAPNSAPNPTSSTPDSMLIPSENTAVDALSQHQLQSNQIQQAQLEEFEARLSKAVDDVLCFESASYLPHIIVLYVVNPFAFGSMCGGEREIQECQSKTALLQTFSTLLHQLNVKRRPQLQLEILDMRTVLDYVAYTADSQRTADEWSGAAANAAQDGLRRLALAAYSQPRLLIADHLKGTISKSMTRFGPASTFADILHPSLQGETRIYKFPSSAYIIAPPRSISVISGGKLQLMNNEERVLFVSYCLVQGHWLCGALTDKSGHLLDTVLINIKASHEEGKSWRYRQKSQVHDALSRLWIYVQGFLYGGETRNWRIVMGRVGKIGHIEFQVWNDLLSKKSLQGYNNLLKSSESKCRPCASAPGHTQIAAIVSACLISIEPEPYLRLFLSAQQVEAGFASFSTSAPATSAMGSTMSASSNGVSLSTKGASSSRSSKLPVQSSTPAANTLSDTSLTLIMAFPATSSISFEPEQSGQLSGQADVSEMEAFFSAEDQLETDITEDIMNIFKGESFPELNTKLEDEEEDESSITNQPIATGFYVSSAPAPDLPDWFWSTCPSQKGKTPVHLKSSLHIHSANVQQSDEITICGKGGPEAHHPLDSMETDEVLRYVLQSYNALSWLNVDFATGNRLSCLPIHIQVLLRLCRGTDCISRM